jgi:hypothetical protein
VELNHPHDLLWTLALMLESTSSAWPPQASSRGGADHRLFHGSFTACWSRTKAWHWPEYGARNEAEPNVRTDYGTDGETRTPLRLGKAARASICTGRELFTCGFCRCTIWPHADKYPKFTQGDLLPGASKPYSKPQVGAVKNALNPDRAKPRHLPQAGRGPAPLGLGARHHVVPQ